MNDNKRWWSALPVALITLGWYLMLPPLAETKGKINMKPSPLNRWQIVGSYDTAKECVADLDHSKEVTTDPVGKIAIFYGLCIATDDPRLKGN